MESHTRTERGQTSDNQHRTTSHIALPSRQVSSLISNDVFNINAPANVAICLNNDEQKDNYMHLKSVDSGQKEYFGNTVDKYTGYLQNYEIMDVHIDTNVPENSYDKLAVFWGVKRRGKIC